MAQTFAKGKRALGICDRCGHTQRLLDLKTEVVKGVPNGLLVCWSCRDADHPQLRQGEKPIYDPQALRNPRPDTTRDASREITGTVVFPPVNGVG